MTSQDNRIYFLNNPYPKGHQIIDFKWTIDLIPSVGLWFNFHLKTDWYYAEDDSLNEEPESDWKSNTVWENYHACTLSSNNWHDGGFLGAIANNKFDFSKNALNKFHVDQLPRPSDFDFDDSPFSIYLLGHDDCADHKIELLNKGDHFDIKWNGRIALAYIGEYDFEHQFKANINNIPIPEIRCTDELSLEEIKKELREYAIGFENISIKRIADHEVEISDVLMKRSLVEINPAKSIWNTIKRIWN